MIECMVEVIYKECLELKDKIYIVYCFECVLLGNMFYELVYNDWVIGGVNFELIVKVIEFYFVFVQGKFYLMNVCMVEMCKLIENFLCDFQIVFVNELFMICDKVGINVWELIELVNKYLCVNIL